jgi:hypothetical protein
VKLPRHYYHTQPSAQAEKKKKKKEEKMNKDQHRIRIPPRILLQKLPCPPEHDIFSFFLISHLPSHNIN